MDRHEQPGLPTESWFVRPSSSEVAFSRDTSPEDTSVQHPQEDTGASLEQQQEPPTVPSPQSLPHAIDEAGSRTSCTAAIRTMIVERIRDMVLGTG